MGNKKSTLKVNVRIREKKLTGGNISLYLDIYRSGKRSYEFLKLFVKEKPRTPEERKEIKETYQLAEQIRTKRESELNHTEFGFIAPHRKNINYLDFYQNYIDTYTKKDVRMVKNSLEHFKSFLIAQNYSIKDGLKPRQISKEMVIKFKEYLEEKFNGETPSSYFKRFKKVLRYANDQGIIDINPARDVTCTESEGLKKEILNLEEIQILANANCGNPEVKRAFLFCLNTGLRFCDVKTLKYSNIDFANKTLKIEQQKIKGKAKQVSVNLNENAIKFIGDYKAANEIIFNLPSIESSLRTLKNWCNRTSINKHITWHSSRHSFAVNLLSEAGANIKTVSSLLGHASLRHTEVYTRAVDDLKHKAVNNLPIINI